MSLTLHGAHIKVLGGWQLKKRIDCLTLKIAWYALLDGFQN